MITVLAGGVGAARFLRGLFEVVDQRDVTVIGNTGDDLELYGLRISPDLDTVTYTTSGNSNEETGWGLADETFVAMEALRRYNIETWFGLGDRDLGTHLYRTTRLLAGATLSQVTAEITAAWGCRFALLPMSDGNVRTRIELADGSDVEFQEYFVHRRHESPVRRVIFDGATSSSPAPGVIEAIERSASIIIAPSNPILSIGPILSLTPIAEALRQRRDDVIAVSPIIGGRAVKGPADRLLCELGHEPSATGVARMVSPYAATLVVDNVDAPLAEAIASSEVRPVMTNTLMSDLNAATELARVVINAKPGRADLR